MLKDIRIFLFSIKSIINNNIRAMRHRYFLFPRSISIGTIGHHIHAHFIIFGTKQYFQLLKITNIRMQPITTAIAHIDKLFAIKHI